MILLRSLLFNVLFFAVTAIMGVILLPALLLPRKQVRKVNLFYLRILNGMERKILKLDAAIEGWKNLSSTPHIIAMKHQSMWETLKLPLWFDDPAIVLKQELTWIPIWGWFLKKNGVIAIDRAGGMKALNKMVRDSQKAMAEGRHIVIFPQGTRVKPGDKAPYRIGVGKLYDALKVPVTPVWLDSGHYWPKRSFIKKSGRVRVQILPEISPNQRIKPFMQALESALER